MGVRIYLVLLFLLYVSNISAQELSEEPPPGEVEAVFLVPIGLQLEVGYSQPVGSPIVRVPGDPLRFTDVDNPKPIVNSRFSFYLNDNLAVFLGIILEYGTADKAAFARYVAEEYPGYFVIRNRISWEGTSMFGAGISYAVPIITDGMMLEGSLLFGFSTTGGFSEELYLKREGSNDVLELNALPQPSLNPAGAVGIGLIGPPVVETTTFLFGFAAHVRYYLGESRTHYQIEQRTLTDILPVTEKTYSSEFQRLAVGVGIWLRLGE